MATAPANPMFLVFGDYLYWKVRGADVQYAQAFDGIDPLTSVPRGPVGVVSPRFNSGFRAGAGVLLTGESWLVGTFTYFRTTGGSSITAADPFILHSNLTFPNTANAGGDSLNANARSTIDLKMADVDFKYNFLDNELLTITGVLGARYAHLEQTLRANYQIFGTTTVNSDINFDGGGPRVGLEGLFHVCGPLFGYGKGGATLLLGRFNARYEERNIFIGQVGLTSIGDDRVVPVLELELGLGLQCLDGRVRVSGGYYVGNWINTLTVPSLAIGIRNNNFSNNGASFSDTITFDGFVGRLEFRF
jgi:hypothetical protein